MSKALMTLVLGAVVGMSPMTANAWEPAKAVEIVVAAGAGGASDQMARMLQAAVQKNSMMKQPIVVSLKGGASGAEGLMYMKTGVGDPHKFIIAYSLIYTLPLSAKIPFDWRELTPVSIVAFDQFVLWVNADSPHKTAAQFLARYIDKGTPWAHLDIAGTVWADKPGATWDKGATGYGVRLLDRYVRDVLENPSAKSESGS